MQQAFAHIVAIAALTLIPLFTYLAVTLYRAHRSAKRNTTINRRLAGIKLGIF